MSSRRLAAERSAAAAAPDPQSGDLGAAGWTTGTIGLDGGGSLFGAAAVTALLIASGCWLTLALAAAFPSSFRRAASFCCSAAVRAQRRAARLSRAETCARAACS